MAAYKKTFLYTLIIALVVLTGTALLLRIREVPPLSQIKKTFRSADLTVLDRHGFVLDEVKVPGTVRRMNWVPFEQVPSVFIDALLASENYRLSPNSITRQLSKGKFWRSLALETVWTRRQILEAYINLSVYRGELQGIAAAAQALFDRPPAMLSRSQSAVLVALIRNQGKPVEEARGRACAILKELNSASECALISLQHLQNVENSYRLRPFASLAPQVAHRLALQPELRRGNVVQSTLDRQWQWDALNYLQMNAVTDGALVVLDNKTGQVLVYVGNSNGSEGSVGQADLAMAPAAPGSVVKPFLYAKALDERTLTAATVLSDKNEIVSVRGALLANMKVPAIQTLGSVGADAFVHALTSLGLSGLRAPEMYGPSLALGQMDARLLEITNAYRTLANRGLWSPIRFSPDGVTSQAARRVFSEGASFIISDILRQPGQQFSAVFCDQWCVGYSERYTLGMLKGGKELWQRVMAHLQKNMSSDPPAVPAKLRQLAGEWFLEGTLVETAATLESSRISYPKNQSLIELDPGRPKENARLFFQVVAPRSDQNLYLNGVRLGRAQSLFAWRPESGRYLLELRDAQGIRVDKVQFDVKGLSFAGGE